MAWAKLRNRIHGWPKNLSLVTGRDEPFGEFLVAVVLYVPDRQAAVTGLLHKRFSLGDAPFFVGMLRGGSEYDLSRYQIVDGQAVAVDVPAADSPFADQIVVALVRFPRVILAKVNILARDADTCLPARLVEQISWLSCHPYHCGAPFGERW